MHLNQYLTIVLQEISEVENYSQVEAVISRLVDPGLQQTFPPHKCIKALETKIENLSPIPLSSTQWSCLRYALICLRNISREQYGKPIGT